MIMCRNKIKKARKKGIQDFRTQIKTAFESQIVSAQISSGNSLNGYNRMRGELTTTTKESPLKLQSIPTPSLSLESVESVVQKRVEECQFKPSKGFWKKVFLEFKVEFESQSISTKIIFYFYRKKARLKNQ